jgi:hypothetical protein
MRAFIALATWLVGVGCSAPYVDPGDGGPPDLDGSNGFVCGEGNTYVICYGECTLRRSTFSRAYLCSYGDVDAAAGCTVSTVSAPGECGCYLTPTEAYLTICEL